MCGGDGTDDIKGGDGNDVIRGEGGNDTIDGDADNDNIDGGTGDDNLRGSNGDDYITGGDGNDALRGDNNNDVLDGGNGNDTLQGDNGGDVLVGGPGTDNVDGGNGVDTCDQAGPGCETASGTACAAPKAASCVPMSGTAVLVDESFASGAGQAIWPENIGWDGDFNGDWFTDGVTARPHNRSWGTCATCPLPATTGFVKTINVCPGSGARLSMVANIAALQTSAQTRTTLVLYFIGETCNQVSVTTSYPRFQNAQSTLAFYDAAIPAGTVRIIVAPMAYLAADETNTVFYKSLKVTYEPSTKYQTIRTIAADDFTATESGQYGDQHPAGWGEFGGDWLVHPSGQWATLWNASWSGAGAPGQPPVDTGITKSFTLGAFNPGDVVDVRAFAATSFSSSASLAQLRLIFNDAAQTTFESNRLTKNNWDELRVRRAAIPAGATSAKVVINAYLGATESSSLYVDDLAVTLVRP
ncbi:MAG: hypothetical protein IT381_13100 [Deltaproteobacteria bacterium]|nr:hypothetical protein [Deltaproteobacteria bacterium]